MKIKSNFLFFLILTSIVSCKIKEDKKLETAKSNEVINQVKNNEKLDGTWRLIKVNDTLFNMSIFYGFEAEQPTIKINRENNRISGFSGCNIYEAPANFNNNKISLLEPVTATEIGCEKNIWETDFFNRLLDISSYEISKHTLEIVGKDGRTLTLKKNQ